jgi:Tol biopolymer transport system component
MRISLGFIIALLFVLSSGCMLNYTLSPKNASAPNPPSTGKILFGRSLTANQSSIFVMNGDGTSPANLSITPSYDQFPEWSTDGSKIVFTSSRDGNDQIYSMKSDGSGQTRLSNNSFYDWEPCWSPDGTKVAFSSSRSGNFQIYSMNADGMSAPVEKCDGGRSKSVTPPAFHTPLGCMVVG